MEFSAQEKPRGCDEGGHDTSFADVGQVAADSVVKGKYLAKSSSGLRESGR